MDQKIAAILIGAIVVAIGAYLLVSWWKLGK
jgi:hypothetical protein